MKSKDLHIFSARFPYTKFEVYLESEVAGLATEFNRIIVYPFKAEGEITRVLPDNVSIELPEIRTSGLLFRYFFIVIRLLTGEMRTRGALPVFRNLKNYLRYLRLNLGYVDWLRKKFKKGEIENAYSNWFVDWSSALCIYKRFYNPEMKILVKCHRYDLYEEEYFLKFIPFREFEFKQVDAVVSISEDGMQYLRKRYPAHKEKLNLFRLGSPDHGVSPGITDLSVLRIVSCSNMKPVKRLEMIIEIVSKVKRKIEWHHFGDGSEMNKILEKSRALPKNCTCFFHGRIHSAELYQYYRSTEIALFLNLSSSEGIPVSIMEAISFGIPVLATNVGGTAEIVSDVTGKLISSDVDTDEIADFIEHIESSGLLSAEYRARVREFWERDFNAKKNTKLFVEFTGKLFLIS